MHLSLSRPTHPRSGRGGDLQELFDKFPTPGDDFMLQIPYKSFGMRWGIVLCDNRKYVINRSSKYYRNRDNDFSVS